MSDPILEALAVKLVAVIDEAAAGENTTENAVRYSAFLDCLIDNWLNEMRQATKGDVLAVMRTLVDALARAGIRTAAIATTPEMVASAAGADSKARMN